MSDPAAAAWIGPIQAGVTVEAGPITFEPISEWERGRMRTASTNWMGLWPDQIWPYSAWLVYQPAGHGYVQLDTNYIDLNDPNWGGNANYVSLSVFSQWTYVATSELPLMGAKPDDPLLTWSQWQGVASEVFPQTRQYIQVISTRSVLDDCRLHVTPLDITIDAPPVPPPSVPPATPVALLQVNFPN